MIARDMAGPFGELLRDPGVPGAPDSLNPAPVDYDEGAETAPGQAYLSPGAMPDDPRRMAVIGVIDDAIPFAHERLRTGPGAAFSRAAAVWLQDAAVPSLREQGAGPGGDLPFGREWRGTGIDGLLRRLGSRALPDEDALYRAAGALDVARPVLPRAGFAYGHGAAVALLAAGHDPADPRGRDHPLIAVSLPAEVSRDTTGTFAPAYILAATLFILHRARRLARGIEAARGLPPGSLRPPVVINLSYGLTAGPRDGSHPVARLQDAIAGAPRAGLGPVQFVLPSGNHRQARLNGRIAGGETLDWRLHPDDATPSAVELWGPPLPAPPARPATLAVRPPGHAAPLAAPLASRIGAESGPETEHDAAPSTEPQSETTTWLSLCEAHAPGAAPREIARLYRELRRTGSAEWREGLTLIAAPTAAMDPAEAVAPAGLWSLRLEAPAGQGWTVGVQRDDVIPGFRRAGRQSRLEDPAYRRVDDAGRPVEVDDDPPAGPVRRRGSVNAYACGQAPLRVSAALADGRLAPYTGLLPDAGRDSSGDILAMADRSLARRGILVHGPRSGGHQRMSGTSVAAPQATRWLARRLAEGAALPDRAAIVAALVAEVGAAPGTDPLLPAERPKLAEF